MGRIMSSIYARLSSYISRLQFATMRKMKNFLAVFAAFLLITACDPKPVDIPETPRDELIIGTWRSVVHREDGNVVNGEGYREFEFREDNRVLIEEFEEDGSPIDDIEDNWQLIDSDEQIEFDTEGVYDVISMTIDSMTLEYDKPDPFSGQLIRHSDDFLKQ